MSMGLTALPTMMTGAQSQRMGMVTGASEAFEATVVVLLVLAELLLLLGPRAVVRIWMLKGRFWVGVLVLLVGWHD